jgi:hypothetical protein
MSYSVPHTAKPSDYSASSSDAAAAAAAAGAGAKGKGGAALRAARNAAMRVRWRSACSAVSDGLSSAQTFLFFNFSLSCRPVAQYIYRVWRHPCPQTL